MKKKSIWVIVSCFTVAALILSSCGLAAVEEEEIAPASAQLNPLLPDFDYADWYQSETGWEVQNYFGAWVLTAHKESVYIGFGSNAPTWDPGDGALLTKFSGNQMEVISTLDEQGIHTMVWHNDTLYIPGIDPHFEDEWDAGNFYRFVPPQ